MNILVLEKTEQYDDHPMWARVRERGHKVYAGEMKHCRFVPDAVISWGVTLMDESFEAEARFRNQRTRAKLFCYNWDVYEWVWTTPRPGEYDYQRYGDLLRKATEIWVPSNCTGKRTTQWYGLNNWKRILSSTPTWEHNNVRDDGYALCCLREIPDPWWGMFEKCCTELGISYKMTRHELGEEQYRDAVAGCRFICAPLYELSTGGLSLTEAYYHGKPVLLSDSEWNGGRDYFLGIDGCRAVFFKHGDENHFKAMLRHMYDDVGTPNMPFHVPSECRDYVVTHFSDERMGDDVADRLEAHV